MATWKKILVSGSQGDFTGITSSILTDTNLVIAGAGGALENSGLTLNGGVLAVDSNSITSTGQNSILTGSFSGSFIGDATLDLPDLTEGAGISDFVYDGSATANIAVSGAASLSTNIITKWSGDAFVDSSITDNGSVISGASSISLTGASSKLTGSFTGSFIGDGSQLTGLVTELGVSGSDGTGISINILNQDLTVGGTTNEIETTSAGTTLTIGLPDDVTIERDLTVDRNLVVKGTASFQHTEDLDIADRFIRLASGSTSAGDGGIVIQQTDNTDGEAFAFDSAQLRWGLTSSFDASENAYTPDAFMAAVTNLASTNPNTSGPASRYDKAGNIYVSSGDESIWVYS